MIYQSNFADSDQPRHREAYRDVGTVKAELSSEEPANCSAAVEATVRHYSRYADLFGIPHCLIYHVNSLLWYV